MKCPHCGVEFHDKWSQSPINRYVKPTGWHYRTAACPRCNRLTLQILLENDWRQVYPIGSNRGPVPAEVPKQIAADYVEACRVLTLSAKASAALSRRCLQAVLNDKGYKGNDLAKQIDQLLSAKVLPTHIQDVVDPIRNFGNFGAHPINDKTSLQIIDVQPEEAEWCIEILEALFDHFYVGPERAKKKKAELNAKLKAAGKPPSK